MNKLKKYLLAIGWPVILVAALTLIGGPAVLSGGSRSNHKGDDDFERSKRGSKVITLAEDLEMSPGETIELDPVKVGQFSFVSFLGTHSGGFTPVIGDFVFSTEKEKFSDPVPRSKFGCNIAGGDNGGVGFCDIAPAGRISTLRVGGPFLAGRLTNQSRSTILVTLKVYLSK